VATLYTASDPAVIKLIEMSIDTATRFMCRSVCSQMCGNPLYTMLLLGMGLRTFSVTPAAIPGSSACPWRLRPPMWQVAERPTLTALTTSARVERRTIQGPPQLKDIEFGLQS
jgi:phosphoenolpyruvate-protein kinase (PTS system EI component)